MSFTPEQLATPLGQMAVAIYYPDPPNPSGVGVLSGLITLAMQHCIGNGGLTIQSQTKDWNSFDFNVLSGATFWTIGYGVLIGELSICEDGSYGIDKENAIAKLKIIQDPDWHPLITDPSGQGPVTIIFTALSIQGCRNLIENN